MKKVTIIFRKELLDTLRDRRTLMTMIIVPIFLYPVLMVIISSITMSQAQRSEEKVIEIGYFDQGQAPQLAELLNDEPGISTVELTPEIREVIEKGNFEKADSLISERIRSGQWNGAVVISENFQAALENGLAGDVRIYYHSTAGDNVTRQRLREVIGQFRESILILRFEEAGLDRAFAEGVVIQENDVATTQEQIGFIIGGILPYFFLAFCFMGSMYPAIDLAAGEKERGTIETILTSPATKLEILLGKMGVVMVAGIVSALLSLAGIFVAINFVDAIPPVLLEVLYSIIDPVSILLLLIMLLPLSLFFACFLLSLSIYAKSFKEAQSLITPLVIVVLMPAIIGMLPGIELNLTTALIPVLNVSLMTKHIISGTVDYFLFLITMASLILISGLALWFCIKWFGRERNILR